MNTPKLSILFFLAALVAFGLEIQYRFSSAEVQAEVLETDSGQTWYGDTTYYTLKYSEPGTQRLRTVRFPYNPVSGLILTLHRGDPRRGEVHPLRIPSESALLPWHRFGYWYCEFPNAIGLGLIAVASLFLRIDRR